jgi:hypothetical protein
MSNLVSKKQRVIEIQEQSTIGVDDVLPPQELRVRVQYLIGRLESYYLELAKRLYEVKMGRFYFDWGYDTWSDYCEIELGIGVRKADYLVQIWETAIMYPKLQEEYKRIGWTKAKELARLVKLDGRPSVLDKWIEVAKNKSLRELENYVRQVAKKVRTAMMKKVIKKDGVNENNEVANAADEILVEEEGDMLSEDKELYQMTFVLYESAYKVVLEALSLAKKITNSESRGFNLHAIALEFLAAHGDLSDKNKNLLGEFFRRLEHELGLAIIAVSTKTGDVVYGEEYIKAAQGQE